MRVFIITEGSRNIGFGHITRCLSLYQAFEEKGILPLLVISGDETINDFLKGRNFEILNWIEEQHKCIRIIKNADIAIIDSYLAGIEFYRYAAESVEIAVYMDDEKRMDYPGGIILNGSIYAEELGYPPKDDTSYLLGRQYTLLRKEFWNVPEKEIQESVQSVMVTFGGEDAGNMTPRVLKMLADKHPDMIKHVIVGRGFQNIGAIEDMKDSRTNLLYYPDAEQMKNSMLSSDLAISAGGQTLYELAKTGVPTIAVTVSDNQALGVLAWEKLGFVEHAGWFNDENVIKKIEASISLLLNFQIRKTRSSLGRNYLHGSDARRCVEAILKAYRSKYPS